MTANPVGICLLVADFDSKSGGLGNQTSRLVGGLLSSGFAPIVCTRNYARLERDSVVNGVRVHRTPTFGRSLKFLNSVSFLLEGTLFLVRQRNSFDVIHATQMFGPAMLGTVAGKLLRKPVVVRLTASGELGEVATLSKMKFNNLRRKLLRGVSFWIALTSEMAAELRSCQLASDNVAVIPNGAPRPEVAGYDLPDRADAKKNLGLASSEIAIVAGRLSAEKNIDILLHAWRVVRTHRPGAQLVVLGTGGHFRNVEKSLKELSHQLGLDDCVKFLGHVDNVYQYLLVSDLFVLPSRSEGMSNALVEAMAAGVPVLAADIPANRDLIASGVNGLLVEPNSIEGLIKGIEFFFQNPNAGRRYAKRARESVLKIEDMVSRYREVYIKVLA